MTMVMHMGITMIKTTCIRMIKITCICMMKTPPVDTGHGIVELSIFENGMPPRFRLRLEQHGHTVPEPRNDNYTVETERADGGRQVFRFVQQGGFLESVEEIPEPHDHGAAGASRTATTAMITTSSSASTASRTVRRPGLSRSTSWATRTRTSSPMPTTSAAVSPAAT